ncbi:maleylpyruvate isomerase family mycothiol-dependent enzyme [Galactobacter caseinivorans]|uniref:Maleylpyruvate isomerase family mycothiol-dependent enzyme n=1 Tax=Galactobacter caseinivorans TaxID=2676123 RepID=A0A496PJY6_9MICC|nr:maleylpyruvate isomerase family mycothiol-dependent enzyme [Galactobacter caseinivorans]RKW70750.1 maleylpyruvate isomerase family mycothiol-dependent enzyme [Galactobacter caseinivorans]
MNSSAPSVWPAVHAARSALVCDLDGVPPERFATASLCAGWDVHDVVAHLVESARTTRRGFVWQMLLARGDFDAANAAGIRRERRERPEETVAALAQVASWVRTPPGPAANRLVEVFVHGEDIRRPLGIASDPPPSDVALALAQQLRTTVSFGGGKERAAGLGLEATDTAFVSPAASEQPEAQDLPRARGRAIDLLLAVSGRSVPDGALSGAGAATMLARREGATPPRGVEQ